jgi:hypothetical protein
MGAARNPPAVEGPMHIGQGHRLTHPIHAARDLRQAKIPPAERAATDFNVQTVGVPVAGQIHHAPDAPGRKHRDGSAIVGVGADRAVTA